MDFSFKIKELRKELEKAIDLGDVSHVNYLQGKIDAFEEAQDVLFKTALESLPHRFHI